MTNNTSTYPVDVVLDEFFYSSDKPTKKLFKDFVAKYPEYRYELADFAVHWLSMPDFDDSLLAEEVLNATELLQVQSQILSKIYASDTNELLARDVEYVRQSIDTLKGATVLGIVSEALGLPSPLLLGKVLRGRISDIPRQILFRLAKLLRTTPDLIREAILARSAGMAYNYSASDKPFTPIKESWAEAVRREGLPKEVETKLLFDHGENLQK